VSDHIGRRELLIGAGAAFLAAEATGANTADSDESVAYASSKTERSRNIATTSLPRKARSRVRLPMTISAFPDADAGSGGVR
jgi:hypothetical protein